jgi:hypothetical protein
MTTTDTHLWRVAEAQSLEAQADCLQHAILGLEEAEQVVRDEQTATQIRELTARFRTNINDWRAEAHRLRVAADELASA